MIKKSMYFLILCVICLFLNYKKNNCLCLINAKLLGNKYKFGIDHIHIHRTQENI